MRQTALIALRESLYEEVWSEPMTLVAERYGVSDVGLAKICRKLFIPLPGRGYWAKIRAGRAMRRKPLPKIGDKRLPYIELHKVNPTQLEARRDAKRQQQSAKKTASPIIVPLILTDPHPLISATAKYLTKRTASRLENGIRSNPEKVLHVEVTDQVLDRALLIFDTLIKELAKRQINVRVDCQKMQTILDVDGAAVSIKLSERIKATPHIPTEQEQKALERYQRSSPWNYNRRYPNVPRYDFHPTGILTIKLGHNLSRRWSDTQHAPLQKRLGDVIAGLMILAAEIKAIETEKARKEEEYRQAVEKYQYQLQRRENEIAAFKAVEEEAKLWERACRLRAYADALEFMSKSHMVMPSGNPEWIAWVRAKADWLDPVTAVCDPILDAPKPCNPVFNW